MAYGLEVRNSSNNVVFSSLNAQGGVCVGGMEVSPGNSQTLNFPQYAGRLARAISYTPSTVTISYASGYPSVTLTVSASVVNPQYIVIFIY